MIQLTNKQTHYQVAFESELFEVTGTLVVNENGIDNLYGNILEKVDLPDPIDPEEPIDSIDLDMPDTLSEAPEGPSNGSFSYSEWNGTYSENISGLKLELKPAATVLIDEIVEEIKLELEIE